MDTAAPTGFSRRSLMGGAAILAAVIGVPIAAIRLGLVGDDDAPSESRQMLMKQVSQIVIPATNTPGAGDVGAGEFVLLALAHGLEKSHAPLPAAAAAHARHGTHAHTD